MFKRWRKGTWSLRGQLVKVTHHSMRVVLPLSIIMYFGQFFKTGYCMTNNALCTKAILSLATGKSYPLSLVRRAGFIIQKAWTVTVAIDATYIVRSTGGKETIAVQNRYDCSFHFSSILDVEEVHLFLGRQSELNLMWPTNMPMSLFTSLSQPYTIQQSEKLKRLTHSHFESLTERDGSAQLGLLVLKACNKPMTAQTHISMLIKNKLRHWLTELQNTGIVYGKLSPTNIMFNKDKHGLYIRVLSWENAKSILDDNLNTLEAAFADVQGLLKKENAKKALEDKKLKLAQKLKTA
ncbi:hypothetical protein CPB85DRAFT_1256999 [Mucidula mucida]|nr:hypothetical protein CPB85DRAFT_1256999 [Mucidula mucida]